MLSEHKSPAIRVLRVTKSTSIVETHAHRAGDRDIIEFAPLLLLHRYDACTAYKPVKRKFRSDRRLYKSLSNKNNKCRYIRFYIFTLRAAGYVTM